MKRILIGVVLFLGVVGIVSAAGGGVADDTHSVDMQAPETANVGEEVLVKANVTAEDNFPGGEENVTVELLIDGEIANTTTVTVTRHDPGEAVFAGEFYESGERNVTVVATVPRGQGQNNSTATNTTNVSVAESDNHVAGYNDGRESFRSLTPYEQCLEEAEEDYRQPWGFQCDWRYGMFLEDNLFDPLDDITTKLSSLF